jgi:cysteine-rich repeat protein
VLQAVGDAGDFDAEMRYARCEWLSGDANDGIGGLGGVPPQQGFDAGDLTTAYASASSGTPDMLTLCERTNVGAPGIWRFKVRGGVPGECGNGRIDAEETCDDANLTSNDGCSAACVVEPDTDGDAVFDAFDNCVNVDNYPGILSTI